MVSKCQASAILFTDIVGSMMLMSSDSAKALELVPINWKIQKPLVYQPLNSKHYRSCSFSPAHHPDAIGYVRVSPPRRLRPPEDGVIINPAFFEEKAGYVYKVMCGFASLIRQKITCAYSIHYLVAAALAEKHDSTWIKEIGDRVMALVNTALDAVNSAVEIQKFALSLLIFLVLVGTFWSISGSAQNYIDLLRIEYSGSMGNDFEAGAAEIHQWIVDATIPIVLTKKNTLLTGMLFESTETALYAGQEKSSFYTLNLKLGLNKKYSETWSATYLFLPKLSSDLQNIGYSDFQFGAAALLKFTKNKNLNFKFGAFYNSDKFGPFISPLAGLYYQHKKWEYNILLPRTVDINYQIVAPLKLGLRFNGYIKSYNLNDQFQGKAQYLVQSNNEIGVYLGWSLGRIDLLGMLGHSIGRNYRTYEQGDELGAAIFAIKLGDDRTQLNTDFKDGLVFRTSLIYRFDLDN